MASSYSTYSGPPAANTTGSDLADFGGMLSIFGAMSGAVGSFYAAKTQQYQLKSQALAAEFEQSMANLNARAAEHEAQSILDAGQHQIGQLTLAAGQERGARRASTAAAGIQAGVGSAAEAAASAEFAKQVDVLTINSNAVRAAGAARTGAVNQRNQALLSGVSARNLRAGARSIDPGLAAGTSLLGGAGQVAQYWAYRERRR